ncbi:MAG TPA: 6-phosphogluconolactonase [Acidimicrobiia bacterium]|nr:6-phosphogluconolactonase [Acidimicrobiia bacterium]
MSLQGEVRVVDDVRRAFAELFVEEAPPSLTVSGGSTAHECYKLLADADVEWSGVDVFFGDERWVPVDDPDSNEGMARQTFLDRVGPRDVHSMRNAGDTVDRAADAYDRLLRGYGPLDFVHLGLGPDGHTASLFPGSPALDERERLVVATGDDLHPHPRLTVTFPALKQARLAVFTVGGEEKRKALQRVRSGDDLPGARVSAARVIWLVDRAAYT